MKNVVFATVVPAAFAAVVFLSGYALADMGEEAAPLKPLAIYPGSVAAIGDDSGGPSGTRLTKDSLEDVKKHFSGKLEKDDHWEAFDDDNSRGWRMMNVQKVGPRQVVRPRLTIAVPSTPALVKALGALKSNVIMGKHTEAEYQAMEKKFSALGVAYFRPVKDEKGATFTEDEYLYRKTGKALKPAQGSKPSSSMSKAEKDELKKQMQAMKASGDYAGMMKLAQESQDKAGSAQGAQAAQAEMQKDDWDLWVKCLEDTKAVAYWTRISYGTEIK